MTTTTLSPHARSRITNGKPPIGMGRRWRDILAAYIARAKGDLDETQLMALRSAATAQLRIEELEAQYAAGKRTAHGDEELFRLCRLRRVSLIEAGLGLNGPAIGEERTEDLGHYLAELGYRKSHPVRLRLDEPDEENEEDTEHD